MIYLCVMFTVLYWIFFLSVTTPTTCCTILNNFGKMLRIDFRRFTLEHGHVRTVYDISKMFTVLCWIVFMSVTTTTCCTILNNFGII
jgi:hypothetical protein